MYAECNGKNTKMCFILARYDDFYYIYVVLDIA